MLNYNHIDFVGYENCGKLISTSGKGCRNTYKTSKQGIPKININTKSTSSKLGFGYLPHKDTCDILSEMLVSQRLQAY